MEKDILYKAIQKVNDLGVFECNILGVNISQGKREIDAQVMLRNDNQKWNYNVEIKTKIVPAQITTLMSKIEGLQPYLIVSEYITTKAKKILRNHNISYIDTAGNIFLRGENLYVLIETNKTNRNKLTVGNRAFSKAGLKVVYQFLINPDYINKPYRFIGNYAKVTIDTVRIVLQGLLKGKYIIQVNEKEYQFLNRSKLFQEWVTAFNKTLRPKLKQTRYAPLNKKMNWKKIKLSDQAYWGGAVAAEIVTDDLIADKIIVYTDLPFF